MEGAGPRPDERTEIDKLYLKHLLVRTPLERPAKAIQQRLSLRAFAKNPELLPLGFEDAMLDAAVTRLVGPESHCVDIGCHLGSMLSLFCRLAPRGRKYAFEPSPKSAARLRRKFPDVDLRELALSDAPGRMSFHVSRDSPGHSSLGQTSEQGRTTEVEVEVSTLDRELLDEEKIDFVKLDVEGAELNVLRGGAAFLGRHRPRIQFECTRNICKPFGYDPLDLFHHFTDELGYEVFDLPGALTRELPELSPPVFDHMQTYPFGAFNYVALPAEVAAELRG